MVRKGCKPEQITNKLREAEILFSHSIIVSGRDGQCTVSLSVSNITLPVMKLLFILPVSHHTDANFEAKRYRGIVLMRWR
jgi:hypothetical protein